MSFCVWLVSPGACLRDLSPLSRAPDCHSLSRPHCTHSPVDGPLGASPASCRERRRGGPGGQVLATFRVGARKGDPASRGGSVLSRWRRRQAGAHTGLSLFLPPPPAVRGAPASSLTRLVSRPLVLVGVRLAHGFRHPTPLTSGISVSGGKIYLARLSAKKKVCVDISYPDKTVRRRKARDASHRGP